MPHLDSLGTFPHRSLRTPPRLPPLPPSVATPWFSPHSSSGDTTRIRTERTNGIRIHTGRTNGMRIRTGRTNDARIHTGRTNYTRIVGGCSWGSFFRRGLFRSLWILDIL
ncbi:uncharacterized protein LOC133925872 [Phragmites australis]|uniref:uncharacterized protein LOC133925872 n=1 Tax=Phragmites australis TaxID=29695 RepID=UPI002D783C3F|nr:uncharacterized protein LOC133925872 [Phragmites australis]